ncbi:MAG: RNA polymerase sigma factor [Limisphaerales bacterium]
MTVAVNSTIIAIREQVTCPPLKVADAPLPASDRDSQARALASAVARGEERAFAELYDRYQGRLFRLILALSHGDESLARETVQSAFLTAAAKLRKVASDEHLWNWLAHVARQHLSKAWRRQERDAPLVSLAEMPEQIEPNPSDHVQEEMLDTALLSMEGPERQLLEWFYFDGLSQKDIALRMRLTTKAVSSRLERARAKLRALLTQERFDHDT